MEQQVTYRPFRSGDASELARIILDTWSFDEGIASAKQAAHFGYVYLYFCMLQADFTQVAEVDGRVVGVILGRTCGRRFRPRVALRCLRHSTALALSGAYKKIAVRFDGYDRISNALDEMSGVTGGVFDAEVALFIVDKSARGCGVGSALFERLNGFFREKGVRRYYLHTDSACNYEFYERKGLRRLAEMQTEISYAGVENIEMFVYGTEKE